MRTEVTPYYLEMWEPAWLHASSSQSDDIELKYSKVTGDFREIMRHRHIA